MISGYNDVASNYINLRDEWDYNKNYPLLPTNVTIGSNRQVWWKDTYGHEWQDSIAHRTKEHRGCPVCGNYDKISEREIKIYYYIHKYFQDTILTYNDKTADLSEIDIYIPSIKTGIEYDGQFYHKNVERDKHKDIVCKNNQIRLLRIREPDCPIYASDWCEFIYLKNLSDAELKNAIINLLTIFNVKNISVDFDNDIADIESIRNKRKQTNSLLEQYPDVAGEWNYEKNGKLTPEFISYGSKKRVWWICNKCQHEWVTSIYYRTGSSKTGCPKCGQIQANKAKFKLIYCPETHTVYENVNDAALKTNNTKTNISAVLRGRQKTTGKNKLHWYYVYDQVSKDYTIIPGAISLGLIQSETLN